MHQQNCDDNDTCHDDGDGRRERRGDLEDAAELDCRYIQREWGAKCGAHKANRGARSAVRGDETEANNKPNHIIITHMAWMWIEFSYTNIERLLENPINQKNVYLAPLK